MARAQKPTGETTYYPNGNVKFKGAYLDGEMHGEWAFYRTDGSMMRSGSFDRGRQVGIWRTFDRAGRTVKETDISVGSRRRAQPSSRRA